MASELGSSLRIDDEAVVGRYVEAWITGRVLVPGQAIGFAEDQDSAAMAVETLVEDDVLFVPTGVNVADFAGATIEYDGRFGAAGDELTVCGHTVELQDYLASGFIDIIGPTCARIQDLREWDAFLADADEAYSGGPFPRQFLEDGLLLAGSFAFFAESSNSQAFRPYFSADGTIFGGPQGESLDAVALQAHRNNLSGPVAEFEGSIPRPNLINDCSTRPWLGRYLRIFDLLKRTHRDTDARIVGFGHSILDDGNDAATPSYHAPYLSFIGEDLVLEDLATGRRFKVPVRTAAAIEALMTSSKPTRSAERLAECLAIEKDRAWSILDEVASRFGFKSPASLQAHWAVSTSATGLAQ
ncbi:daptide biosynthesis RiPP recognition protein [Rathayibacter iranicus]|uniref:Uncharacterized protein n=1 Tax=Rathayibacter iranicus NCPPB 2253 = VKM Ac-1602 TaxID=1328868 RepID=A0ABX5LKX8_9MICO|nr:daptide biosynthesis RiPP recognition protein [Rathayibacter iranicus]MWV29899.1 hypothetical protein [Rathayibacter iranicus NCPPB 2253 = VKM Ac-1602]PWJ66989.1 hypothetical protein B0H03_101451 [Rathayibacter iranicus NCPPB 2253 = VKM Ac-1602]